MLSQVRPNLQFALNRSLASTRCTPLVWHQAAMPLCRKRRLQRIISPIRNDAFAMGDQTPDASVRTYADVMREQQLARERDNTLQNIRDKQKRDEEDAAAGLDAVPTKASGVQLPPPPAQAAAAGEKRRNRWDQSGDT